MRKFVFTLLIVAVAGMAHNTVALAASAATTNGFTATDQPNIMVNPVQGPSVTQQLGTRAKASWPWYITRAAGFTAAIALVLLMLSGIGFITGATFRFLEPLTAWATHKAIAIVFAVSILVHGGALLFDKFVPFTLTQVLLPFSSHYNELTISGHHFGSLYVALGVMAMYFVMAIILTSLFWIDKKPHTWKIFHFLAYLTMIFVFFHALYLGTDLMQGVLRVIWIILGALVAIAIVYRIRRRVQV